MIGRFILYLTFAIAIVGITATGAAFSAAGWQFALGFACGFFFLYVAVRVQYGFWVDPLSGRGD